MAASWLGLVLVVVLQACCFTVGSAGSSNVYIVYMRHKGLDEPQLVQESHHQILSTVLGSKEAAMESILYSYKHGFSGFAAVLTQSQSRIIADSPGVARVVRNKLHSLHTTRSWDFLQVKPRMVDGIISRSRSGVGSVIGIMDTGIWPESESFNDIDMGEIPSTWKGICQEGERFNHSNCNRKIIGARWYIKGYEAEFGSLNTSRRVEFLSPRDAVGHGTHTSSTACGALIENASFMGLAQGRARGGAPSASIAVYKVCWSTGGCSSADLLAAFDDAILDGVDVLSISLGSSPPLDTYVDDVVAVGSFHAVSKGIAVVCSAGNSGPFPQTVINTAPWIITVAASTIDRGFPTVITLGNNQTLLGQGIYTGKKLNKFYPLVYGEDIASTVANEDSARSCELGTLNASLAKGKVVLCIQSRAQRSASLVAESVRKARGAGLVFAQFPTKDISLYSAVLPSVQVDFTMATTILAYMESTRNPVLKFSYTRTTVGKQISPEVAFFSSRGPSSLSPSVLKPDIAAPGVNILASWSPASSSRHKSPLDFKIESGTSMSCPHISGIIALLKAIHPTWSPAALKSALVTTASTQDEYGQAIVSEGAPYKQADPFDYGGGHVDPNKAANPGLIFDMATSDYIIFLCSMGYNNSAIASMTHSSCHRSTKPEKRLLNLNLPSIAIPELKRSLRVSRTVTNVGPERSVYVSRVNAPPGTVVRVSPERLAFTAAGEKLRFSVSFRSVLNVEGRYSFGNLFWEDGFHVVKVPLVVKTAM